MLRSSTCFTRTRALVCFAVAAVLLAGGCAKPRTEVLGVSYTSPPAAAAQRAAESLSTPKAWPSHIRARRGAPTAPVAASSAATTIVAAPNGTRTGDGTTRRPLDLATALSESGPARAGSTVLLRGGTYVGTFTSTLRGTPAKPIVVMSYRNEWAVLDSRTSQAPTLTIRGSDTWFRDFEVTKTDTDRVSDQAGPWPTDIGRGRSGHSIHGDGVYVFGERTKLINLLVHDAGNGIGFWRYATDAEIYGCVVYNNGWIGADHAWGHGAYVHNETGTKKITDSVFFNNFSYGLHAYSEDTGMRGLEIQGVTSFNNGIPGGRGKPNIFVGTAAAPATEITVRNNALYHARGIHSYNLWLGYPTLGSQPPIVNGSVTAEGNVVSGGTHGLFVRDWQKATVTKNVVHVAHDADGHNSLLGEVEAPPGSEIRTLGYHWDANTYYDGNRKPYDSTPAAFDVNGNGSVTFEAWRQRTGFDATSRYSLGTPAAPITTVRPNKYERGRGLVTVFNWGGSPSVSVNLSSLGLRSGQTFEIKDVQNMSGAPLLRTTYSGRAVTISLTGQKVTQPVGIPTPVAHTSREFGTFIVIPR